MFLNLREQISGFIRARHSNSARPVVRTFYLVCSESLFKIKEIYKEYWPSVSEDTEALHQWILVDAEQGSDAKALKKTIHHAFDAEVIHRLSLEDVMLREACNQLVVIGDLGDLNLESNLQRVLPLVLQEISENAPSSLLFSTGIFLLGSSGQPEPPRETLTRLVSQQDFHRLLLLDEANGHWKIDPEGNDAAVLCAQLAHFLTVRSENSSVEDYGTWLKSSHISGCSSFTLAYPLRQLIEFTAVEKAASILNAANRGSVVQKTLDKYFNGFIAENRLVGPRELQKQIVKVSQSAFVNPLDYVPDFSERALEDYTATVDELDAAYLRFLEINSNLIDMQSSDVLDGWKEALDELVDQIIAAEPNGFKLAAQLLDKVEAHSTQLVEALPAVAGFNEPKQVIDEMRQWYPRSPSRLALWARALVLALATGVVISTFPISAFLKPVYMIGGALLGATPVLVRIWLRAREVENMVVKLTGRLSGKWQSLMQERWGKTLKDVYTGLEQCARTLKLDVQNAEVRFAEVTAYFAEDFLPEQPKSSASWTVLAKDREDYSAFSEDLTIRKEKVLGEFYGEDQPLRFWRRMGSPSEQPPSEWEAHAIEVAALRTLSFCEGLTEFSVQDFFERYPERIDNYAKLLLRGVNPYIRLKPAVEHSTSIFSDFETGDQYEVTTGLSKSLKDHFNRVGSIENTEPGQLNCYSFEEGIKLENIIMVGD